jgi:hypothetical protein
MFDPQVTHSTVGLGPWLRSMAVAAVVAGLAACGGESGDSAGGGSGPGDGAGGAPHTGWTTVKMGGGGYIPGIASWPVRASSPKRQLPAEPSPSNLDGCSRDGEARSV